MAYVCVNMSVYDLSSIIYKSCYQGYATFSYHTVSAYLSPLGPPFLDCCGKLHARFFVLSLKKLL